ncbi:unnamed protein product, partial [Prunus brigantina]
GRVGVGAGWLGRWVGVTRTEKEVEGVTRTDKEVDGFAAVGGDGMSRVVFFSILSKDASVATPPIRESKPFAPPHRDFGVGIYGPVLREIGFINIHNKSNNHHPIEPAKEWRIREGTKERERERERNQRAFGAGRGDGVAWLRWVLWGRGDRKRKKGKME